MIVSIDNWKTDVYRERSLWEIFASSAWIVGRRADTVICFALFLTSSLVLVYCCYMTGTLARAGITYRMLQEWSALTATLAATILGFLVAGFAIFATMSRREFFVELAQFRVESRPISQFKFVFFNFMFVFVHYIFYTIVSISVAMLWVAHSPSWFVAQILYVHSPKLTNLISGELAAAFAVYTLYILLVLRGFIWNLYQALLIVIFEAEHSNTRA